MTGLSRTRAAAVLALDALVVFLSLDRAHRPSGRRTTDSALSQPPGSRKLSNTSIWRNRKHAAG